MINIKENENYIAVRNAYPRIADTVDLFWGHDGFEQIVSGYLNDTRDGKRQGFPPDIASALLRLIRMHHDHYPQYNKEMSGSMLLNDIATRRD